VVKKQRERDKVRNWNAKKRVTAHEDLPPEHRLKQTLSWPHLIALGVGAIVGTGILTLIGVGAAKAGPSVILSFAIAGIICAAAALAYAEMATMIPASGSAYTYTYVVIGELIAWIVGWSLILEYSLVVSAVAVGWSGYAAGFMESIGAPLPAALVQGPALGGIVNLPAIFIIGVVAGLLILGAGSNTIRWSPPLILQREQADVALEIFEDAIEGAERGESLPADQEGT
jgi:APA family basic amino acid/polyamine antiporter